MQLTGIEAIYRKQRTSLRQKGQATRTCFAMSPSTGQVWASDVTYLPIAKGFCLLGGDPGPLQPQGARLSGVQHPFATDFCIEALEEALGLNR